MESILRVLVGRLSAGPEGLSTPQAISSDACTASGLSCTGWWAVIVSSFVVENVIHHLLGTCIDLVAVAAGHRLIDGITSRVIRLVVNNIEQEALYIFVKGAVLTNSVPS